MQESILLWSENNAPNRLGDKTEDHPRMFVYRPSGTLFKGSAMLIFPGGAYRNLADHEGEGYAVFFASYGFTCFVLHYRLGQHGYRHPTMLMDAQRAVRWIRANASVYQLNPDRIIVIGSSAGGHLAATLLTYKGSGNPDDDDPVEREDARPNAGILCYPVIPMLDPHAHAGSRNNLLGVDSTQELRGEVSAEKNVTKDTPPCFIWHSQEDRSVPVEHALLFAGKLRRKKVNFEIHIYEKGEHGLGLNAGNNWPVDCLEWLKLRVASPE